MVERILRNGLTIVRAAVFLCCWLAGGVGLLAQGELPISDPPVPLELQPGSFITKMWDEALSASRISGKPALIFNVDYVDSPSIVFRDKLLQDEVVRNYLRQHFELGLNDFSVDPPPTVGFDSLRNLGLRLSGLEKKYNVVVRPTAIVLQVGGSELGRIVRPNELSPQEFVTSLEEILQQKNTIASFQQTHWNDPSSVIAHIALVDKFEERSDYDSVVVHLNELRTNAKGYLRQLFDIRYSYLRLNIEGNPYPLHQLMSTMDAKGKDSGLYVAALWDLLRFYDLRKKPDSLVRYYDRLIEFTHGTDPDIYNDLAFTLANFNRDLSRADSLVDIALSSSGRNPNYLDTKAFIAYMRKDYPEAARHEALAAESALTTEDKEYFADKRDFYQAEAEKVEKSNPKNNHLRKKKP